MRYRYSDTMLKRPGGRRDLLHVSRALLILAVAPLSRAAEPLRMNQIQVIATHNSYHLRPEEPRWSRLKALSPDAREWDYSHADLDVQLERGVRSFEIDLWITSDGFDVLHVPVLDFGTSCADLALCLGRIKRWSDSNPGHIPVVTIFEIKSESAAAPGSDRYVALDAAVLARLDERIVEVFGRASILTPDEVRGDHPTLNEAVTRSGWPPLDQVRGRHMFVMMNGGAPRGIYTDGRPSLEGRIMFTRSEAGDADGAFILHNDPDIESIRKLVNEGYMVRTRADSGLRQGRSGDTRRRDSAMASGAQIITTDFPPGEAHPDTGYVVVFEDGATVRCNPVNAPEGCSVPAPR